MNNIIIQLMQKCNFKYISKEYLVNKALKNDAYDLKEFPHIWHASDWQKWSHISFNEVWIEFHNTLLVFHNNYSSLLEAEKKEKEINKLIREYSESANEKSHQNTFIKKREISKYSKDSIYQYYIGEPGDFTDLEITYYRDSAFYAQLFAFLLHVLKEFFYLLTKDKEERERILELIEKRHKGKTPEYVLYGECIDYICDMNDLEQLFYQEQYKLFNKERNLSMHELAEHNFDTFWGREGNKYKPKVHVCECFLMIKQLLYVLETNKEINKRVFDLYPELEIDLDSLK